jgi:hypothetical protein
MNSLYIIVAVLAAVTMLASIGTTTLQQTVFAIGDPNLDETAKGHGDDVSRQAIGDPGIVPGEAMGHGDEVSDAARTPR